MKSKFAPAIALALGAATMGTASAADLAAAPYAAPGVAAIYNWSGFYIGINGGVGSGHNCWDFVDLTTGGLVNEGCHNATGGTAGGQIGYREQAGNWVFGFEAQGNWADFSGDNISLVFPGSAVVTGDRNRTRIDAFGLFTGQVGYAWNNALFYVKGGGAVVGERYDIFAAPGTPGAGVLQAFGRETRWGGTVGAGLEFGFAPNWSVGVEYDHLFLNVSTIGFTTSAGVAFQNDSIRQDVDMALVRVNYRFGVPAY